ncbi:hypothetical protein GCM10010466_65540 [Planomonospora alba]|uniref:Uncharacterized protein n=1 Tax=Planomonospora alba TaxID=161354 RepID=A0ABP6P2J9_9ACTN
MATYRDFTARKDELRAAGLSSTAARIQAHQEMTRTRHESEETHPDAQERDQG